MAILQNQTQTSLEAELSKVNLTQVGIQEAVTQAREMVEGLQEKGDMSEKDAKMVILQSIKDSAEEDGGTLEQMLESYPAALTKVLPLQ